MVEQCWVSRAGGAQEAQGPCGACIRYERECARGDPQCTAAQVAGKLTTARAECGSLERCDALRVFAANVECCSSDACNSVAGREPASGFHAAGGLQAAGPVARLEPLAWVWAPSFTPGGAGACEVQTPWPDGEEPRAVLSGQCYWNPASEMHEKYPCSRARADGGSGEGEEAEPLLNYTLSYFEEDCTTPRNVIDAVGGGKTNSFSFSGRAAAGSGGASWGTPLRGCLEGGGQNQGYGLTIECTQMCEVVSRDPPEPAAAEAGGEPCRDLAPHHLDSENGRARVRRWSGGEGGAAGSRCQAVRAGAAGAPAAEAVHELGRCLPGDGGLTGGGGSHGYFCGEGRDGLYGREPRPVVHLATYGDADCGDGSFRGARQWHLDGGEARVLAQRHRGGHVRGGVPAPRTGGRRGEAGGQPPARHHRGGGCRDRLRAGPPRRPARAPPAARGGPGAPPPDAPGPGGPPAARRRPPPARSGRRRAPRDREHLQPPRRRRGPGSRRVAAVAARAGAREREREPRALGTPQCPRPPLPAGGDAAGTAVLGRRRPSSEVIGPALPARRHAAPAHRTARVASRAPTRAPPPYPILIPSFRDKAVPSFGTSISKRIQSSSLFRTFPLLLLPPSLSPSLPLDPVPFPFSIPSLFPSRSLPFSPFFLPRRQGGREGGREDVPSWSMIHAMPASSPSLDRSLPFSSR